MEGDWTIDADEQHRKDYYKVLEINYDATDEDIRLSYRRLALKWHPDKHIGSDDVTTKFQEINEAYRVLSDTDKRIEYDLRGIYEIDKYTLRIQGNDTYLQWAWDQSRLSLEAKPIEDRLNKQEEINY